MGNVLDAILQEDIVSGPETINSTQYLPIFDVSKAESDFSIQFTYDNGSSVNMNLSLEISTDKVNFVTLTGSIQNITDSSGSHIWDVQGTGTIWARVYIEVTAGSIDLQRLQFSGKRRH